MNNFTYEEFQFCASVFNSPNSDERRKSYQYMEAIITQNPALFSQFCMKSLEDPSKSDETKRIILILLIKALKNGPESKATKGIWTSLDRTIKDQLLATSFTVVLHPNAQIKKQGANLISTIFCLDRLNEKIWPNIIDSISKNVEHQDQGVREAAIYSLSFICEYTQEKPEMMLAASEIESLLSGIFNSLQQFNELTLVAVDALKFSTDFVIQRMHKDNDLETADYVFNILIELLIKCQQNPHQQSDKLITGTITCLKDICEGFFAKLNNYKDVIFEKILSSLTFNSEIVNTVFFFFQGIFEMEYIEQTNYTQNIYTQVQSAVMEFLLKYDQLHYDDEGGSSLTDASFQLLKSINKLYIKQTITNNLNYVYANIEINNINNLCAAIIVLKSMVEYAESTVIEEPLQAGFQSFVNLLQSNHPAVVTQTLQLFAEVAQHLPEVLYVEQHNQQILVAIEAILSNPNNYCLKDCQMGFEILIQLVEQEPKKTKNMTKSFRMKIKKLLDFICDIAFKTKNNTMMECCFTFFFSVIQSQENVNELINYFDNFRQMLKDTASSCQSNSDRDQQLISYIQIVLNAIITKLNNHTDGSEKIKHKQGACIEIYELCKEQISYHNELIGEPFELMCSILLSSPESQEFKTEVKNFIRTYIQEALQKMNQMDLYIQGINFYQLIVDKYQFTEDSDMNNIFQKILELLTKEYRLSQDNEFQALQRALVDYMNTQPKLIDVNFESIAEHEKSLMDQLVYKKLRQFKSKDLKYMNESALQICELHQVLLHHVLCQNYGYKHQGILDELMKILAEFFMEYVTIIKNPGQELASLMLGIMSDYQIYKQEKNIFNNEFIKFLVGYLKQFQNNQDVVQLLSYCEQVFGIRADNLNQFNQKFINYSYAQNNTNHEHTF